LQIRKVPHFRKIRKSNQQFKSANLRFAELIFGPPTFGTYQADTSIRIYERELYINYIYAPMIDTAPCVMLLMRAASITWARERGLGLGNFEFFAPQMALAYRLDEDLTGIT
jgi:hypothetical protein